MARHKIPTNIFSQFHIGYPSKREMIDVLIDFCVTISEPTQKDKERIRRFGETSFIPCIRCPIHAVCEDTKPASFEELNIHEIRRLYKAVMKWKYGK